VGNRCDDGNQPSRWVAKKVRCTRYIWWKGRCTGCSERFPLRFCCFRGSKKVWMYPEHGLGSGSIFVDDLADLQKRSGEDGASGSHTWVKRYNKVHICTVTDCCDPTGELGALFVDHGCFAG
jgi:hypothetical protein